MSTNERIQAAVILRELTAAVLAEESKKSKALLATLRNQLNLSDEEFCERIGVESRTWVRWLDPEGNLPKVGQIKSWRWTFGLSEEDTALPQSADTPPSFSNQVPGIYDDSFVMKRIREARRVVAARSRSLFRAGDDAVAKEFMFTMLQNPDVPFELLCLWLKPTREEGRNEMQARPVRSPKESFASMRTFFYTQCAEGSAERALIDKQVRWGEIDFESGAQFGLADLPVSLLLLEYTESAAAKYARPVELWLEIQIATYKVSGERDREERSWWVQVHPPIAKDYWLAVWKKFFVQDSATTKTGTIADPVTLVGLKPLE